VQQRHLGTSYRIVSYRIVPSAYQPQSLVRGWDTCGRWVDVMCRGDCNLQRPIVRNSAAAASRFPAPLCRHVTPITLSAGARRGSDHSYSVPPSRRNSVHQLTSTAVSPNKKRRYRRWQHFAHVIIDFSLYRRVFHSLHMSYNLLGVHIATYGVQAAYSWSWGLDCSTNRSRHTSTSLRCSINSTQSWSSLHTIKDN